MAKKKSKKPTATPENVDDLAQQMSELNTSDEMDAARTKEARERAKKEARDTNIVNHFDEHYESLGRLQALQKLCEDIGVEVGPSITKCRKILQSVYINIVDFVSARQQGRLVRQFASLAALRKYTSNNNKYFPLKRAKDDTVLRYLLVHMSGWRR